MYEKWLGPLLRMTLTCRPHGVVGAKHVGVISDVLPINVIRRIPAWAGIGCIRALAQCLFLKTGERIGMNTSIKCWFSIADNPLLSKHHLSIFSAIK